MNLKCIRLIALLAIGLLPGSMHAQNSILSIDFEDEFAAGNWQPFYGASTNILVIGDAVCQEGMNSMYVSNDGGMSHHYSNASVSTSYMWTLLNVPSTGRYEVSYDWMGVGLLDNDYMRVCLAPISVQLEGGTLYDGLSHNTVPSDWIALDGGSQLNQASSWQHFENTMNLNAGRYWLVVCWNNNGVGGINPPAAIDNIEISMAQCSAPTHLSVSNIVDDHATVSWQAGGLATSWLVEYGESGFIEGQGIAIPTSVANVTLSGLLSDVAYDVYVKSVCGVDEVSESAMTTFQSDCDVISLPYSNSFESTPTNQFPNCWNLIAGSNSVILANSYLPAHDGNKMMRMKDEFVVASPMIPLTASDVVANFWLKRENYVSGDVLVGYTTDLSNIDNMTVLNTITLADNEWHFYEVDGTNLSSELSDGYLVWKQVNTAGYGPSVLIDDVHIQQSPTCKRPNHVSVSEVSHHGATIRWDATESGVYELRYGTVNDVDASDNIIESSFESSFVVTDLMSATTYYAWVRSECGNEHSEWSLVCSFTTEVNCASVTDLAVTNVMATGAVLTWNVPTSIGIAPTAVEVAWKTLDELNYTKQTTTNNYILLSNLEPSTHYDVRVRTICNTDTAQAISTSFATMPCGVAVQGNGVDNSSDVPADCNMGYSYAQMLYPASALMALDSVRGVAFNIKSIDNSLTRNWDIYLAHTSSSSLSYANCIAPFSMKLMASVQTSLSEGWNVIQFDSAFAYDHSSNLVVIVDDNTGSYGSFTTFYSHEGSAIYLSSSYNNIDPNFPSPMSEATRVPDIIFIDHCAGIAESAPMLVVDDVTSSQVSLAWDDKGANVSYQVEYKLTNVSDWTPFGTTTNNHVTITGLESANYYDFRVGTVVDNRVLYSTISVFTECDIVSAPLYENFDAGVNPCWTMGSTSDVQPNISGAKLSLGYVAGGYIITPEFENALSELQVQYSIQSYNVGSQLEILVGSDPSHFGTFVAVDTVATVGYGMTPYITSLADYHGSGRYIAFHALGANISLDNISIESVPLCVMPDNVAVDVTGATTADVSWEGNNGLTVKWLVDYCQQGDTIHHRVEVASTDYGCSLVDLEPNTTYEVWVSNVCQSNDTLTSLLPVTFHTLCGALVLNQVENFESTADNEFPYCWSHIASASYEVVYSQYYKELYSSPVVISTLSDNHKALNLFKGVDVISPLVPLAGNQIMVKFDAMSEDITYAGDLVVGFSSSNSNLTDMVAVDTLHFTTTAWNSYEISFANLATTDEGYVVFQNINYQPLMNYRNDTTYKACLIDNVTISQDFHCEAITQPQIVSVDDQSVTLQFTDPIATGHYSILYGLTNNRNEAVDTVDFTTTTYQLQGLQPDTRYYAWIRNNCLLGGSSWVPIPTFHTTCGAMTVPYIENFSTYTTDIMPNMNVPTSYPYHTMPSCWTILNMSSSSDTYPQAYLYDPSSSLHDYAAEGTALLMLSKAHSSLYAVLPLCDTPLSDLQISFTYRQNIAEDEHAQLELGVMTNALDTNTFVTLQSYPRSMTLDTVYHHFGLDSQLSPTSHYRIAFRYRGGLYNDDRLGLDNVSVVASNNCITPEQLSATAISTTSATLSWLGNANQYTIHYRKVGTSPWQSLSATTTTATLNDLTDATLYEAKVQALCSEQSLSEWSKIYTFTTECGAKSIPYTENFDSYTTDVAEEQVPPATYPHHIMPLCWSFPALQNSPKVFLSHSNDYAYDSTQCLLFVSSNERSAFAVLPAMEAPIDVLQLKFIYRNETVAPSCGNLTVGVMTLPSDTTTFIPLETYARQDESTEASHLFATDESLSTNATYYIAFRYGNAMNNGYFLGLDSIVVDYAPTCEAPTHLTAQQITSTSAELSWNGTADSYDVEYRTQGFSEWTIASSLLSETHITLNNLQPATTYEWHVRAHCLDMNATTDWTAHSFQTTSSPCDVPTLLTATPGENMVVLDWNAPESQFDWTVHIFNEEENLTIDVSEHPTTIRNLLSATDYHVAVRANCSDDNVSRWSDTLAFSTTNHSCDPITNLAVSHITLHTAILSWTAGGNEGAWDIYCLPQGASEQEPLIFTTDIPQYGLSGLEASTTYQVKVRAVCSPEQSSEWSAPITFTTQSPQGIDGVNGNYQFIIYPNPTSGATTISLQGVEGQVTISVVDMNGRTVTSETIECGSDCQKSIEVSHLAQGTYFVRVLGDNLNSVRKLIVR